jgi:hypothetical protein
VALHYLREKPYRGAERRICVLMVSDGTARPYRVKIKSPDYASLQAIDTPGRGYYIADVVAIIGSLDVVFEVSIDNSVVFRPIPGQYPMEYSERWTLLWLKPWK